MNANACYQTCNVPLKGGWAGFVTFLTFETHHRPHSPPGHSLQPSPYAIVEKERSFADLSMHMSERVCRITNRSEPTGTRWYLFGCTVLWDQFAPRRKIGEPLLLQLLCHVRLWMSNLCKLKQRKLKCEL